MKDTIQPIDIVIAWVDGNDPKLKNKRQQFINQTAPSNALDATRFASNDEIYFCIASILKFVPYCGKIYVVTDQQTPQWLDQFEQQNLCEKGKIRVVDHTELFRGYEFALPTFNSLSIETMLWNIPSISDYFIYLNDDFFFNQPSDPQDFLIDSQMVMYGHWESNLVKKIKYIVRKFVQNKFGKLAQPSYTMAQMLSADCVGMSQYFEIHHRPHILSRILLCNYFEKNMQQLQKQISFKFRNIDQILPVGLSNHLAIKNDQAILNDDVEIAYLKDHRDLESFTQALSNPDVKFGCIQSLDQLQHNDEQHIRHALIHKFKDVLPSQIQATIAG
ncbi:MULTISPECIES: Stealth CR1 domain-containing protein [Acinetobacter]|uniref:Stealth CR1 domain-containing protein n=1 Tax=Acinetobacter TaxID=469 RepID=UPI000C2BB498|nr:MULTISPECIES: Stealth CR1 domain-containing protein [Acinetobacter]ATZ68139.1 capsular polysaccharide biosynthesis protein [Acinetobacter haemolyticus]MBC6675783.1 Stealth CR1 domain-containing protein [Acinetobacter sp.]MEB6677695.1 stealth family protein [Acinetobacter haemolyticus]NAR17199.1 capsular polysaccharide biosynthesis protein [Acinetobacter haemolyticus]NAR30446.1 capsular polysaccharide biosynthesis protein [Acinetobacter haemolyticus]